jgi:single-strand DNA-binding protein
MNLGIFTGRLGKDSELNKMSSGDAVCNFSIANDIGTRDNPKTQWIECALFGKRAEALHPWLKKGVKVSASGRVTLEAFTSRDGSQKSSLRLTISEIDMHLPPKGEGQTQPAATSQKNDDMPDQDIPF